MTTNNGWPLVPLGEAVTHRKEFVQIDDLSTYKRCRVQLHTQGVVLRDEVEGSLIKTKSQQVCRTNEFLVAEIDAKMGGFGLVPTELEGAVVSSHYFLFTPKLDRLDPQFLGYYCRTPAFREQVTSRGTTNYAAVRPSHVLRYTIPLPPLEEQRRIVARIDRLAAKIDEAKLLRRHSLSSMESLINSLLRQALGQYSNGMSSLGDCVVDCCYGTSERTHSEKIGVPILRMGNIQDGSLVTDDLRFLEISDADRKKWVLQPGDILVNRTNSAELVGKSAVFNLDGDWGYASYLIRLRLDARRADPRFVVQYINSPFGRAYMFSERKQMTGQANVNSKKLKALPIPLPPIDEQRQISEQLELQKRKLGSLNHLLQQSTAKLNAMLPSILDRAFKGAL